MTLVSSLAREVDHAGLLAFVESSESWSWYFIGMGTRSHSDTFDALTHLAVCEDHAPEILAAFVHEIDSGERMIDATSPALAGKRAQCGPNLQITISLENGRLYGIGPRAGELVACDITTALARSYGPGEWRRTAEDRRACEDRLEREQAMPLAKGAA